MDAQPCGSGPGRTPGGFPLLAALLAVLALCAGAIGPAYAADPATYTVATFQNWLAQYANAKPDFKTYALGHGGL